MNRSALLSVRALRTRQAADLDVFAFFVRGDEVMKIADISRLHRDETYEAYADVVHDRLCQMPEGDPDYLMLEAFAWLGLVADAQGTEWAGFGDFADKVEAALGDPSITERRFNPTKQTPWRRWMCFLGLGVELPVRASFHPCVTQRLDIELARSDLPVGVALPVRDVLRTIGERMPYLDSGALRASVAVTRGLSLDSNRVSRLLSTGLRDLHDEGLSPVTRAAGMIDPACRR